MKSTRQPSPCAVTCALNRDLSEWAHSQPIQRIPRLTRMTRSQPAFGLRRQPELCQQAAEVIAAVVSSDGLRVELRIDQVTQGYVHDFDLQHVRSAESRLLVHANACDTLNGIPKQ